MLTIIRGLPGSGKSTLARMIAENSGAIFVEPDMMLMQNGKYNYSRLGYKFAVDCCESIVEMAAEMGCDLIYADVLPTADEVNKLRKIMARIDMEVKILCIDISLEESRKNNVHKVADEDLIKMASSWERIEGEKILKPGKPEIGVRQELVYEPIEQPEQRI